MSGKRSRYQKKMLAASVGLIAMTMPSAGQGQEAAATGAAVRTDGTSIALVIDRPTRGDAAGTLLINGTQAELTCFQMVENPRGGKTLYLAGEVGSPGEAWPAKLEIGALKAGASEVLTIDEFGFATSPTSDDLCGAGDVAPAPAVGIFRSGS